MTERSTKIVIFDLDGTITRADTYLGFLLFCLRKKPWRLLRCYFLPIAVLLFKLKLKDNSWLKKTFLGAIAGGYDQQQIHDLCENYLQEVVEQDFSPSALQVIQTHQQKGDYLILASASYDFYVKTIGERLGFDKILCTQSVWMDDCLQGDIDGDNCYGVKKLARVQAALTEEQSEAFKIAYSDHHSDQPLLDWVDDGVAINPTKKLQIIAKQQGYRVIHW